MRNLAASNRSVGTGLAMLLLLAVLVPSVCLLWFMNQAVKGERSAARQTLLEAYRGHLTIAQERLDKRLQEISAQLERSLDSNGPMTTFALTISSNYADSVVCFGEGGVLAYPSVTQTPRAEALSANWEEAQALETSDPTAAAKAFARLADEAGTNSTLAARALQAQVRNLVKAGQKEEAISTLERTLNEKRFKHARDTQNRLIVADMELMAVENSKLKTQNSKEALSSKLQGENLRTGGSILRSLKNRLEDYSGEYIPSSQRRFLMRELERLFPGELRFPTIAGEDLAARVIETGRPQLGEPGIMRPGRIPGVWQFSSPHGGVLMLQRAENLQGRLASWVQGLPADVKLVVESPEEAEPKKDGLESRLKAGLQTDVRAKNQKHALENMLVSVPAGAALPGWRLGLASKGEHLFDAAADQRIAAYVWIGALVLATVLILAVLVLGMVRRQVALTQLRNDLVANVTHELKTPLSSMRLLVDTLLNSSKFNETTTREYLQLIAGENVRLSRLIDNFLTFSRIERNKYSYRFHEVPTAQILDKAVAVVHDRFNVEGCRLDIELPKNLPPVMADEDALVTVLINLLDNAFKYSGEHKEIVLSAAPQNGSVLFAVKDNGIGLAPRETKRIFKRFYQVDQRLSRSGGGCGLGLSIVKSIVTAHHGKIQVESEPGKGSTFTVAIPLSPETRGEPHNG